MKTEITTLDLKSNSIKVATFSNIYCLGVATVIGGQYSIWNAGLAGGFWEFFGSLIFMSTGYIALALCVSEMAAALPFSGGTYGLARVTLGKAAGYIIGSCETIEYVIYVSIAVESFGSIVTDITGLTSDFEPLYWLGFYSVAITLQLSPKSTLWSVISYAAVFVLFFMCIYCALCPTHANFDRHVNNQPTDYSSPAGHARSYFSSLPHAAWFFVGIETLSLACGDTVSANKTIPKAIVAVLITALFTSVGVLFAASSMPPGTSQLADLVAPMTYGFSVMFSVSESSALIFTLLAKFATAFGFMFAFSRQMAALQRSKLLLTAFTDKYGEEFCLECGLVVGSLFGYIVILCIWSSRLSFIRYLENACLLGSFTAYIGIFASYYVFRSRFSNLAKTHRSPLGLYGAVYGSVVFAFAFICMASFQDDGGMSILLFAVFITFMVVNYYLFAVKQQIYSGEEQAVLFIAYVIKANSDRRQRVITRGEHRQTQRSQDSNTFTRKSKNSASTIGSQDIHVHHHYERDHPSSTADSDGSSVHLTSTYSAGDAPSVYDGLSQKDPSLIFSAQGKEDTSARVVPVPAEEIPPPQATIDGIARTELGDKTTPENLSDDKLQLEPPTPSNGMGVPLFGSTSPPAGGALKLPPLVGVSKALTPSAPPSPHTAKAKEVIPAVSEEAKPEAKPEAGADLSVKDKDKDAGLSSMMRRRATEKPKKEVHLLPMSLGPINSHRRTQNDRVKAGEAEDDLADQTHYMAEMPSHLRPKDLNFDEFILQLYTNALLSYQKIILDGENSTEGGLTPGGHPLPLQGLQQIYKA